MTPRPKAKYPKNALFAVRLSEGMAADLRAVQDRDGVPISEQIRRGIRLWLENRGVGQPEHKRAAKGRS